MALLEKSRWLPGAMLVTSLLGFADATYLTVQHYTGNSIPCTITHGCDVVTKSAYSAILGVPVALLGSAFYIVVFALVFFALDQKSVKLLRLAGRLTVVGFVSSMWFLYAQAFLIHAFCQWCLGSLVTSTVLFVLGYFVMPRAIRTSVPSPLQSASDAGEL